MTNVKKSVSMFFNVFFLIFYSDVRLFSCYFPCLFCIISNERSEYSYTGRATFLCFQEKVLKFFTVIFDFSRFDVLFLFKFISFPLFKERKANSNIKQQKCKAHGKRDRFLVSKKWSLIFRFLSEMKTLPIAPVFILASS